MATKRKRSGTVWGDAEYEAKGYERLTLRPSAGFGALLERLASLWGTSRVKAVERAVDEALERAEEDSALRGPTEENLREDE